MMEFQKPSRLCPGDTVAVLSMCSGAANLYPHVFDLGLANLRDLLGVQIKEYPTTRMAPEKLHSSPQQRADDLTTAFADPEVKAIISSIGGDDSVRLLPYLDLKAMAQNPKILMGFSDTSTLLTSLCQGGLVTYYGPSIMAGFAQMKSLPLSFSEGIRAMLTEPQPDMLYAPYGERVVGFQQWSDTDYKAALEFAPHLGWRWLQGDGKTQGKLFGGCIEVLEFLKGTGWWPEPDFWTGKIFFLEMSEEKPSPLQVKRWLRNYGVQGVFDKISGLLLARPQGYTMNERETLFEAATSVVANEFHCPHLPIVAEMDFGHEGPQSIMPLGVTAEIDCVQKTFRLVEACVV